MPAGILILCSATFTFRNGVHTYIRESGLLFCSASMLFLLQTIYESKFLNLIHRYSVECRPLGVAIDGRVPLSSRLSTRTTDTKANRNHTTCIVPQRDFAGTQRKVATNRQLSVKIHPALGNLRSHKLLYSLYMWTREHGPNTSVHSSVTATDGASWLLVAGHHMCRIHPAG